MNNNEDDDVPRLSMETLQALQEFLKEQEEKNSILEKENSDIQENWQLSQFWYDDETIQKLSNIILQAVGKRAKIALISCPSIYPMVKSKIEGEVHIYEYDKRFSIHGDDFIFYDYNSPLEIPENKGSYYDLVIADPPFLSEECLKKTSETIKHLTKGKIILCTGAVMATLAGSLLGLKKIDFEPKHKNNLGNEFWCYANFDVNKQSI